MSPLFTVVLPTHNRAAMLRAAVRSVLAQTFRDWECFVLDDGSTDSTPRVFEEFRAEPRLRLHRFEDNRRQHVRRNFAIRAAAGEFIAFLDSDDLWLPRRLEAFAEAARARPAVDHWFSNAYLLRWGRVIGTVFDPARPIPEGRVPGWYAVGDRWLPHLTTNVALRKTAFDRVGLFREDLKVLEDAELYARMLRAGVRVGVLRAPLAVRRLHGDQITRDFAVDYEESLLALESGGAPPQELERARRDLAVEVATYFAKDLQPERAREFLARRPGGVGAWKALLLAFLPAAALRLFRTLRTLGLMTRFHPLLAPREFERVRRWAESLDT